MAKKNNPKLNASNQGIFTSLADEIRLVLRLLADRRVNPLLKLIPIGTVVYFFIPDLIIGPIDDALIFGVGIYLFIELCPPQIVEEHRQYLKNIVDSPIHKTDDEKIPMYEDEIIEGEFRDE
ncbi:MAG TPA: hypothetical protein DEH25_07710 [Chloroflexi bacterium]|nr:hypothetical protein [Chloroflexota bacterium]HBY07089.1 hypothetical protein [Chloroflexota bacterium]